MEASQTCGTCAWMQKAGIGQGWCNRYPPTAIALPAPGPIQGTIDIKQMSFSPPVKSKRSACGEHKPKLEVIGADGNGEE